MGQVDHQRFKALLDPSSPDYRPLHAENIRKLAEARGLSLTEGKPRRAAPRRCRWLDRLCGCQWGTCTHPEHERRGKEVGHVDCNECGLREFDGP